MRVLSAEKDTMERRMYYSLKQKVFDVFGERFTDLYDLKTK